MVHYEFLPEDRTVNKEYYFQVMRRLCEAILLKHTELRKKLSWILHHDNAPAHTSMLVREFLVKNKTVIMPQPLYSPDLASVDFFLFTNLIEEIKENTGAVGDIKKRVSEVFRKLEKTLA